MWPALPRTDTPIDWYAAALHAVRNHCGWHVAPVIEETLTLDGSGSSALLLPSNRVVSVRSITEDGKEVDLDSVGVSTSGILRKRGGYRWTRELGAVEVTLEHGHEQYDDLQAVVEQVAARSETTGSGALSETAGPFNIRRGTSSGGEVVGAPLLGMEKAALAPYVLSWGV